MDRVRVRDWTKGSGLLEDDPADVGSSKSKVSGFGADVDGSHIRNMDLVCCIQNSRRRGIEDATLSSSIAAQADWEFCHWM